MTRFARAKGSKASNERVYADPTPWHEMKNEMLKKKQEIEEEKNRREAEAIRNENYKKFLKEREDRDSKKTEWADFPEDENETNGLSKKSKHIKKQNSQIQVKKLKKGAALLLKDGPVESIDKMSELCEIKTGLNEIKDKKFKKKKLAVVHEVNRNGTDTETNISVSKSIEKTKKSKLTPKKTMPQDNKDISVDNADEDMPLEISVKVDSDVSGIECKKSKKKKLAIVENMRQKETEIEENLSDSKLIKKNKKSKRAPQETQTQNENIPEDNSDEDMPLEVSAKVEIHNPVSKKGKSKGVTTKKHYKFSEKTETGEITAEEVDTTQLNNDKEKKQQRKNIDLDSLPEADKKKIERKLEKRKRQVEKKLLKKKLNDENEGKTLMKNNPIAKKIPKIADDKKIVEPKEKFVKQKSLNEGNFNKLKKNKLETGEFKRRKDFKPNTIMVNGNEIQLEYFEGFQIKKEDAQNLRKIKEEMIIKGLPRSEINRTLKLERRKAEKSLAREKKKVCFNCRKFGHNLSECPILSSKDELVDTAGSGICFKCGSTEHTSFACRVVKGQTYNFATCFICKQQGHISRQCPDNDRGLYPKGGSCRVCGDVTHLKKDCPQHQEQQRREEAKFQVQTAFDDNPDDLGPRQEVPKTTQLSSKPKVIKF